MEKPPLEVESLREKENEVLGPIKKKNKNPQNWTLNPTTQKPPHRSTIKHPGKSPWTLDTPK